MAGTTSKSTVPARAEAEQRDTRTTDRAARRRTEQEARDQEKRQAEELKAGKAAGAERKAARSFADASPAEQRHRKLGVGPLNGTVDNMTQRDGSDPLLGHMVHIDYSDKAVVKSLKQQLGDHVEPGPGQASYGVLLDVGEVDPDSGYPITGRVFLRDEHAAQVVLPYDCLSRAEQVGRR